MSTQKEQNEQIGASFTPAYDARTNRWNYDRCALDIAVLSLGMGGQYAHRRPFVLARIQGQENAHPLVAKALLLVQAVEAQADKDWHACAKQIRETILQTVADQECAPLCRIIEEAIRA